MPHRATLGRMLGRVPTVVAPALRHNQSVIGQVLGKLERMLHQRRLGRAHIHEHVRRGTDRGMEEVQMSVMETGADKLLAVVDNRRGGRSGGDHVIGRTDCDDTVACDGNRQLAGGINAVLRGKDVLERIIRSICCMGIPISGRKFNTPSVLPALVTKPQAANGTLPALAAGGILERACTIFAINPAREQIDHDEDQGTADYGGNRGSRGRRGSPWPSEISPPSLSPISSKAAPALP